MGHRGDLGGYVVAVAAAPGPKGLSPVFNPLRDHFLLDPAVVFLNHGSFGACPRPVLEVYQEWQREAERQPVAFFRRADALLAEARRTVGDYLHADPDDLLFVPNATTGLNTVIRSLPLRAGDEILTTDHEYGALVKTWALVCQRTGAHYRPHPLPLPTTATPGAMADALWAAVTPRTRVLFLSHITSPTAITLPVADLCRRARAAGLLTIIDGAHVPGHLPLDLTALDADVYAGNFHKWLCAPRGSAFLHVRREHQDAFDPLVVSHGWGPASTYQQRHTWQGTRDLTAFLSVPAAIDFQREHDWPSVRQRCHELARQARARVADLTGLAPLTPDSPDWFAQMIALRLTPFDPGTLKEHLYERYRIEAPVFRWQGHHLIRLSFQGYNTPDDLEAVTTALERLTSGEQ
jgi:isopenicillin-N epimerase